MASFSVASNGDDGFWYSSTFNNSDTDVEIGNDSGNSKNAFFRFANVTIPKGYTIESAVIRFKARWNSANTTCNLNCYFNTIDTAIAPTDATEANALDLTDAVEWSGVAGWTGDESYDSPELKSILQLITDRAGWATGQALMVVIKDNSSSESAFRRTYSYEWSGAGESATLIVTYSDPFDKTIGESFGASDASLTQWVANSITSESLAAADYAGYPLYGELSESLGADDSSEVTRTFTVSIDESLGSDDANATQWTLQGAISDSLGSDDALAISWNAQCLAAESFDADDSPRTLHSNVYGRDRKPLNLDGERVSLKIQNNTAGQALWLQDITVLGYERDYTAKYAVNLTSHNVTLKIQNDVKDEMIVLYSRALRIFVNENR